MDPEGSGPSQDELGLPEDSGDRVNAPIVQGIAEAGVQSKDTSPLTPEQEQIQQTIDKLKIQNEELDGRLVTVLDSDEGQFYLINSTIGSRGLEEPSPGIQVYRTFSVGVDSVRGPMILSGLAADVLADRHKGRRRIDGGVDSNNVDEIVRKTESSTIHAPSRLRLVSEKTDIGLFGGLYDRAIQYAAHDQREDQIRKQYVPQTLDIISGGDSQITAAKAAEVRSTPVAAV